MNITAAPRLASAPGRILFVDDEQNILDALRRDFSRYFEVKTASGPVQALKVIEESGPPDVIVSDVRMPGMDGIAFLSHVRDLHPDTVRIILTGHADLRNALDAVNECQAFRILSKPCPADKLRQVLDAALVHSRLIKDQRELAVLRRLNEAMEGVIMGFTKLVEARDPYTAGHQRKVASLAVAMGKRLEIEEDRLHGIRLAALVHDIGKIYVPMEFLNKPGNLTALEFSVIKQHPVVGSEILAPMDKARPLSRFVLEHHERLDGSGYPGGLRGEDICPEARVLAVADTVDAILSDRPYRPGKGLEAALREIENGMGTLYDPEAVRACLHLFRTGDFSFEWAGG